MLLGLDDDGCITPKKMVIKKKLHFFLVKSIVPKSNILEVVHSISVLEHIRDWLEADDYCFLV